MSADHAASTRLTTTDFARLVAENQPRLYAFLRGLVGQSEAAADLTQDTFYDAWRATQQGSAPFLPGAAVDGVQRWLMRAGYNNAISWLRHTRHFQWEALDAEFALTDAEAASPAFDELLAEHDALQAALNELAPPDVACLLLRIVHGFSAAEVGAILGANADAVNTRLARAKLRLRAAYCRLTSLYEEHSRP